MMQYIKLYRNFSGINETSEFNLQRFNSDSVQASVHVDNPQLSINAFDKHQDTIRQSMSRVNDIMGTLKGTNAYKGLRRKLSLADQDITNLNILRIIKSETLDYDAYIKFIIGDEEYWGVIENITGLSPILSSEVFRDGDLHQPKEWTVKISGLIIKTIKAWLRPGTGSYKLLNDYVICYSVETGKQYKLKRGSEVELIRSHENKIIIRINSESYNLVGDNFIYFNWWFDKL